MDIGAKIREGRKAKKLTQKQFAQLIGKTAQIVSNWERKYTPNISWADMQKIESVLALDELTKCFEEGFRNLSPDDQARVLIFIDTLSKTKIP